MRDNFGILCQPLDLADNLFGKFGIASNRVVQIVLRERSKIVFKHYTFTPDLRKRVLISAALIARFLPWAIAVASASSSFR